MAIKHQAVIEKLDEAINGLTAAMVEAVTSDSPITDECIQQISKALVLAGNARNLLVFPGSKLVETFYADYWGADSLVHAYKPNIHVFSGLAECGFEPPLDARIVPVGKGVPSCPACLRLQGVVV